MSSKKYGSKFLKGLTALRVAPEVTSRAVEEFLEALDCPRALTVLILWRNSEFEQIAQLEFNPSDYSDMVSFRAAYSATKLLSKYKDFSLPYDLRKVAMEKFDSFESLCKQTNSRFRMLSQDLYFKGRAVRLHSAVVHKIERILGEFSIPEFFSMPDWGPGASTLIKRKFASSVNKFQCETGITRDLYSLLPDDLFRELYPLWFAHLTEGGIYPTIQVGNRVVTVPKDASTDRVIAIEPGINLWFQKSVGEMIGRRLRRRGIDLRYQSKNQHLAKVGSISNQLATIDLSSASDSISKSVVEELFSLEHSKRWYSVMDACRSHFGTQNNSNRLWEKFSSSGNGFTFQLESLIFYAIACCCAEYLHISSRDVSVYGDDIIIPSACFEIFSELMTFYGFQINLKKSHIDSPFRESCGAHYYSGIDIKPIYLKDRLSTVPAIYRLANAVRRLAHRRNSHFGCDARLRSVFEHLVHAVPAALRLRICASLGDGGFVSNFDEATPSRAKHGIEGYRVVNLTEVSKTYQEDRVGYLLAALWKMPVYENPKDSQEDRSVLEATEPTLLVKSAGGRNSVPLRNLTKYRCSVSTVPQWYDLGPWL